MIFSIMRLSITSLIIIVLFVILRINDTEERNDAQHSINHNDMEHNDTQLNGLIPITQHK